MALIVDGCEQEHDAITFLHITLEDAHQVFQGAVFNDNLITALQLLTDGNEAVAALARLKESNDFIINGNGSRDETDDDENATRQTDLMKKTAGMLQI